MGLRNSCWPLLFVLAARTAAIPAAPAPAGGAPVVPGTRLVLPPEVTPERYRIDVTPDAATLSFSGSARIDITVHRPTRRIVLNVLELVIDQALLASAAGGAALAPAVRYDPASQTATLALARLLPVVAYTLSLTYHGRVYQQASGLFALDYATPAGKARALFTQFENGDARRFVPCWDEPARKAVFELSAIVPAAQLAVSNMPIASSEDLPGGLRHVHLAPTPRMSTYLLFLSVGNLERIHRDVGGVDVGVVVKRGDAARAGFALAAAAELLPYYDEYFGVPYPLPKLDLIAGPGSSTFFGAMENWGAIFGFEGELLIDPRISSESDRQRVYVVIAHEMSHQWFGDLVTMQWWDDLWLNEGFASWMERKATDHFHPEWHTWLQQLTDVQDAMGRDARDGTHPVITPIRDVMQAGEAFDEISYNKGAAVVRTLESYVGEDAFRAGVRRYLRDFAYRNAVTDDLWRALDRDGVRPITRIAHDLTRQAGVPMIREISARCVGGRTRLALSQGHFAIDANSTRARLWHVPVRIAGLGGAPSEHLIAGAAPQRVEVPGCGPQLLNAGQVAYLRSGYSPAALAALTSHFAALSAADQIGLLKDTDALAYLGDTGMGMGDADMGALLALIEAVPADAAPEVGLAWIGMLQELDHHARDLPIQGRLRAWARGLLNRSFAAVGWDATAGEADNVALLRAQLATTLGAMDDPAVLAEARRRFELMRADPERFGPASRRTVLEIIAAQADPADWERLHRMAQAAPSELEREQLYRLLGAAHDAGVARRGLELALSGEPEPTLVPDIIEAVAPWHPELAFEFSVAHWAQLAPDLEPESRPLFVPRLLAGAWDPGLIGRLGAFAAAHIPPDQRLDVDAADSRIRYGAMVRRVRMPQVDRWLSERSSAAASAQARAAASPPGSAPERAVD